MISSVFLLYLYFLYHRYIHGYMSTKLLETLIDAGLLSDNGKSAADMMFLSWCGGYGGGGGGNP